MNPFIYWLISHTVTKNLARRCPKCYRVQVVAKDRQHETVRCKWCSEPMPPKTK
ncbi:MAG: hypothetical protein U0Y68_18515 [Blastocatellia bacterium]